MAEAPKGRFLVRKAFDADGTRYVGGSIVDVTDWRNAFQLVDRGYLVAIPKHHPEYGSAASAPVKKAPAKKAPAKKAASKRSTSED